MNYLRIISLSSCFLFSSLQATTLGQLMVMDPVLGGRAIIYEERNGFAMTEGDILLGTLNKLKRQSASITPKIGGSRWSHGIIAYELHEDLPFRNKLAILQAIDLWQQHSYLEFIELTSKNRNEYPDYISFIPAPGTTCSSYVGRQKGKQEINLAPRCTTMNTVHEIVHALGLWHEQSRIDRNSYVRIVWENVDEQHKYNFEQHLTDSKDFNGNRSPLINFFGVY